MQPASLKTFTGLGNLIGSPVTTLNRINSGIDHERFLATAPDLVLSIRYGTILTVLFLPYYSEQCRHCNASPRRVASPFGTIARKVMTDQAFPRQGE